MTWQPIETAPAIGRKKLLFYTNRGVVIGFRLAGSACVSVKGVGSYLLATHWTPLPPAPVRTA